MKKHRLLISGKKFYFRILCFSFTAFFTFTILFLCVSTYTNYNKTGTNIRSIENSNNERITRQFTSFLSQTTVKMSYFSQINIPVDYLENHDLYWSKYIFDSLIKNNFSGTDYISFFRLTAAEIIIHFHRTVRFRTQIIFLWKSARIRHTFFLQKTQAIGRTIYWWHTRATQINIKAALWFLILRLWGIIFFQILPRPGGRSTFSHRTDMFY